MKNIKKISIFLIIILFFTITKSYALTGKVNATAIRLREEPSTTSNIITNIYEGEKVEVIETLDEWYKVKYQDNEGYLSKQFLSVDEESTKDESSQVTNSTSNNSQITNTVSNENEVEQTTNNVANEITDNNVEVSDKIIYKTNSQTNIRLVPNIMSEIVSNLQGEIQVNKITEINNWVQITDGSITGWILKNKLSEAVENVEQKPVENEEKEPEQPVEEEKENVSKDETNNVSKKGKVNVETAKVREKANSSATVVGFLDYDDEVTINSEEADWYQITFEDISGYVSKRLINIVEDKQVSSRSISEERKNQDTTTVDETANTVLTEAINNSENKGKEVVDFAKQYLGYSYVSGGKNPKSGFDCSGFTQYVFSNFGYTLGNTAASQNSIGKEISKDDLQLGDLILFYDEGKTKIGHTGIYIGNGEFVHSANPERGVVIDNLNTSSYYNQRFLNARRIVE